MSRAREAPIQPALFQQLTRSCRKVRRRSGNVYCHLHRSDRNSLQFSREVAAFPAGWFRLRGGVKAQQTLIAATLGQRCRNRFRRTRRLLPPPHNRIKENFMNAKVSASKIGLLIVIAIAAGSASLAAQDKPAFWHITTLYAFTGNADGAQPYGGVVLDPAGNVYGTTTYGGNGGANCGTPPIAEWRSRLTPEGTKACCTRLPGHPGDGANPTEGVTRDSRGSALRTNADLSWRFTSCSPVPPFVLPCSAPGMKAFCTTLRLANLWASPRAFQSLTRRGIFTQRQIQVVAEPIVMTLWVCLQS